MNHWVSKVLQVLSLLLARLDVVLGVLLQLQSEVAAPRDPLPAQFEAVVDLCDRALLRVKAVHATPGTLIVHDVEFLVEEGVETDLTVLETLVEVVENLFVHVVHSVLPVFAQTEEVT